MTRERPTRLGLALLAAVALGGCYRPDYSKSHPPREILLRRIESWTGDHCRTRYDTAQCPPHLLVASDLALLHREPENDAEVWKKALLLHENVHAMNDFAWWWWPFRGRAWQWMSEREGFEAQIRYLIEHGQPIDEDHYVRVLTLPQYDRMCSEQSAREFVRWAIDNARAKAASAD